MKLSIVLFTLVVVACSMALAGVVKEDLSCDSQTASDCLVCCASKNFNKFDHKEFATNNKCRCYLDEKELAFNERNHSSRP